MESIFKCIDSILISRRIMKKKKKKKPIYEVHDTCILCGKDSVYVLCDECVVKHESKKGKK